MVTRLYTLLPVTGEGGCDASNIPGIGRLVGMQGRIVKWSVYEHCTLWNLVCTGLVWSSG